MADHVLRHLARTEAGDFGVFEIAVCNPAPRGSDLFGGNIDDQFAGAIGVSKPGRAGGRELLRSDRAGAGFRRVWFAFEGAAGTENCTFRARSSIRAMG